MKVFISYGRENMPQAGVLAADVADLGHEVWLDRELTGGQAWWDQILMRIRGCDAFVFALSPESLESPACEREWRYADKLGKSVLPVLVAGDISSDVLPPHLAEIQYINYRQSDKQAVIQLMKALGALPRALPLPDPLPNPPDVPLSYLGGLREQIRASRKLTFEEQAALLVTMKQGLREAKKRDEVRRLLQMFRSRDDLLARMAIEVDELLAERDPPEIANASPRQRAPDLVDDRKREADIARQRVEQARAQRELAALAAKADAKRKAAEEQAKRRANEEENRAGNATTLARNRLSKAVAIIGGGGAAVIAIALIATRIGWNERYESGPSPPPSSASTAPTTEAPTQPAALQSSPVPAQPVASIPAPKVVAPKIATSVPGTRLAPAPPPAVSIPAPKVAAPQAQPTTAAISAKAVSNFKPGDVFSDCPQCPEMVVIPAGAFTMGSPDGEAGRDRDEGPQHQVALARAFAVGKYEVTFDEWDACVAGGGCPYRPKDEGWGRGRRPVINVSWQDAQSYLSWLSQATGKRYRLLSEAEWEYAARGGTTTRYPWGDAPGTNHANFNGSGSLWSKRTAPVGSFAANPFGVHDMIGNVWEWVQDCHNGSYRDAPADGRAWEGADCGRRVLRGGSWDDGPKDARAANRDRSRPAGRDNENGFRVARTL